MDGASFVSKRDWQVFFRKLVGKNAKEGIFPRFPGFFLSKTSSATDGASSLCKATCDFS